MTRLVLTRKFGEAIRVNGPAVIRVERDRRGRAKLVIEADKMTSVVREEILMPDRPSEKARER